MKIGKYTKFPMGLEEAKRSTNKYYYNQDNYCNYHVSAFKIVQQRTPLL